MGSHELEDKTQSLREEIHCTFLSATKHLVIRIVILSPPSGTEFSSLYLGIVVVVGSSSLSTRAPGKPPDKLRSCS